MAMIHGVVGRRKVRWVEGGGGKGEVKGGEG